MTVATATRCSYRKTGAGEWVVCGPVAVVKAGYTVEVAKKSGEVKLEDIVRVGKIFEVGGVKMRYGYMEQASAPAYGASRQRGRACVTGGNCSSFNSGNSCGGHDCDGH